MIAVPQVSESYNTNATLGLLQRLNTRLYSKRIKALALLCSGCFAVIMIVCKYNSFTESRIQTALVRAGKGQGPSCGGCGLGVGDLYARRLAGVGGVQVGADACGC